MSSNIRLRLFLMMVLEFVIWGAWLPLIYNYLPSLKFTPAEQSWILNAFPLSAILGIFFSNQFADRAFAAEKFLAFSHLVGGVAILGLSFTQSFWPFFLLMLVHCLLYVPTLSIVNSIAFAHIKDPQKEFGPVRMGGSIGWIMAAWPFTFILVDWNKVHEANPQGLVNWLGTVLGAGLTGPALQEATRWTFVVSALVSFALALYSLTLPHTPPKKAVSAADKLAWLEAMRLLRHPYVLVLWIVALLDAFVLYAYFNWTGSFLGSQAVGIRGNWIMPVMSIGQVAEILTMMILGGTLRALGWRTTMIIGILGHAVRFGVFAFFPEAKGLIVAVNILHGICYAFFFATVYIFVDEYFPSDIRASAQGLFNIMIFGVGALVANSVCPSLMQSVFTHDQVTDFRSLFLVPLATAIVAALILGLFFHPPRKERKAAGEPVAAATH
jgi:nucleoside transporter